ncbi:unnamed protein product [Miscanthus lutarioriparius]|uniref:Uncharacterized protein n=1 Tax=Miscanthus lutarioriparius TaxID=422564 RepID=A0A811S274_9POAL|nr:unnamed protein product [Miscanthus lutarioriparius]
MGRSSSIRPPSCRKTQSFISILETRSQHPPHLGKCQEEWPPTMDSCTRTPHREYHLHGLTVIARVKRQQGEEETKRTYSIMTLPPPPHRCR